MVTQGEENSIVNAVYAYQVPHIANFITNLFKIHGEINVEEHMKVKNVLVRAVIYALKNISLIQQGESAC